MLLCWVHVWRKHSQINLIKDAINIIFFTNNLYCDFFLLCSSFYGDSTLTFWEMSCVCDHFQSRWIVYVTIFSPDELCLWPFSVQMDCVCDHFQSTNCVCGQIQYRWIVPVAILSPGELCMWLFSVQMNCGCDLFQSRWIVDVIIFSPDELWMWPFSVQMKLCMWPFSVQMNCVSDCFQSPTTWAATLFSRVDLVCAVFSRVQHGHQCLKMLSCAQMLMHPIARRGCANNMSRH